MRQDVVSMAMTDGSDCLGKFILFSFFRGIS